MNRSDSPRGILVVTIDRLPAWMLSATGCTWVAMPTTDRLAGRGLSCDRVIATGDDPVATLAALAAGAEPACGGQPSWPLVAAAAAAGWNPVLVTDDERLAAAPPAAVTVRHVPVAAGLATQESIDRTNLGRLFRAASETLAAAAHRLVWCHASSLGTAWDAPLRYRERYLDPDDPPPPAGAAVAEFAVTADTDPDRVMGVRQVVAGQLTLLDECLGRLVAATESPRGTQGSEWTILVAGVRGLGLGLHGMVGSGPLPPFSELVHLPAVLVDHRGRMAAQRYGGLLVPADLGGTLGQLVGIPATSEAAAAADPRRGRDLDGLLDRWQGPDRDRVICRTPQGVAVATPAWHMVLPAGGPRPLLFAKPDDYFEVCDVADRCPDVAEELAGLAAEQPPRAWSAALSAAAVGGL